MIYFLLSLSVIQAFLFFSVAIYAKGDNAAKIGALILTIMQIFNATYFFSQLQ